MVGAEMPTNSDMIKWAEQGRLHSKYTTMSTPAVITANTAVWTIPLTQVNPGAPASSSPANGLAAIRQGQTVMISLDTNGTTLSNKAVVTVAPTAANPNVFTVGYYESTGQAWAGANTTATMFIYGSEFAKGTPGMVGSNESQDLIFDNKPIIIKDQYTVNGSDMAQIGWIEVTTENGANGYYGT